MVDASFAVEDPSTEDFTGDIVVHGGKTRAPTSSPPIGPDNSTGSSPQGGVTAQPVFMSDADFGGAPKGSSQATQGQGTSAKGQQSSAAPPTAPSAANFMSDADFAGTPSPDAGALQNSGDEGYLSGLAKGAATATIKGGADLLGWAGNLDNLASYLVARGESAVTGEDPSAIMQRAAATHAQAYADLGLPRLPDLPSGADIAAPVLAKTGDYVPDTELGKMGQAGLEGAISAFAPGGIGSKTGAVVPGALSLAIKQAPEFALQTAAGQGATDVTGDPLLGAAAGMAGSAVLKPVASAAGNIAAPIRASLPDTVMGVPTGATSTAQRLAGQRLASAASDQQALRDTLNGTGSQTSTPVVPGSKPTLGQLSGDMGILQAERAARMDDVTPFNEREAQQNTARRNQIEGRAPANADTMRVPAAFEQQRADLDKATQGNVAAENAQKSALRGRVESQSPEGADVMRAPQTFRDRLNHIDQATQRAIDTLTRRAQDAASGLGVGATPEARGSAIRTSIEAAKRVAKALKTKLYNSIDPENKLNIVAAPVREAAKGILGSVGEYDEAPQGAEATLLAKAKGMPDVLKFKDLRDFDRSVTTAMKEERRARGESGVHARLVRLKSATQDAIDNGVENQKAYEADAVARGEMSPEDTIEARTGNSLEQERDEFLADRRGVARSGGTGDGASASSRSNSAAGRNGAVGSQGSGYSPNAGLEAVSGEKLSPNFDKDAADRLDAAKSNFKNEYAPTYKEGAVAKVLAGPFSGKYNVLDSSVPGQAVLKGDRGYQTAAAFIKASKNSPDAIGAMTDHVLDGLREPGTLLPIGVVSPTKYAKWKADYAGALRAIDEHVPGFSSRFDSAAHATDTLMEAGRLREQGLDDFQKSAAGQFLGATGKNDPSEVENAVGKMLSDRAAGPTKMEALVNAASRDPQAVEGLKKAGVDWMLKNLVDKNGDLDPAKFQKFVSANRASIQKLYGSTGLGIFASVGHELSKIDAVPASAAREELLSQFQKGAAGQFLGGLGKNDPSEVENAVGKILMDKAAGPTKMEALVKAASADPEAVAGLKKAAIDWMMKRFSTTAEAGTSKKKLLSSAEFQEFMADNKASIEKLFGSDTEMLQSVADDLERANRPISATRIGGSPGTSHDAKPMFSAGMKKAAGHSSMMTALTVGMIEGYEHFGVKGAATAGAAGALSYLIGTMRHAGLNRVDALVRDALLNPERARVYLSKAPTSAESGRFLGLASSIRRQLIGTPINMRGAK
jgi:hypothetical protein